MTRITNEQREAIVRQAVATRDALLVGADDALEVPQESYLCISPACGANCRGCNSAISPGAMRKNAVRFALLERMDPRFGMPVKWLSFKTLGEAVDHELAAIARATGATA